ncbi:hypothetical protein GIB67_021533 [Kingdonia uniflora]|uniref:Uncharacterized protein n=1 Tax=Kingdonia uniflora TaxID=39325 RepID=A0A7J7L9P3_9MAGN|nr:hypothetical protein GIB67_021533 [Kingdonia uniflora]
MGASTSSEQKELEFVAASTGALLILQKAFSKLCDPQINFIPLNSLHECFSLNFTNSIAEESSSVPECFPKLLANLGSALVNTFFTADEGGFNWVEFLRGYIKCCGRASTSLSLNTLCRLYAATSIKAGITSKLEFESDDLDCKISGSFMSTDVLLLLCLCWIMSQNLSTWEGHEKIDLPDVKPLVLSAITVCTDDGNALNVWDWSISGSEVQLPAQKCHMWALTTAPSLGYCFAQYVNARLRRFASSEVLSFFLPFELTIISNLSYFSS